jgi:hypothetical protein
MRTLVGLVLVLVLLAPIASAEEKASGTDGLVRALLAASVDAERADLLEKILAAKPDPAAVAGALAEGRAYGTEVEKGWLTRTVKGSDGKDRPYVVHVPESYDPAKRYRLLFDLHGGVSRPALIPAEGLLQFAKSDVFWGPPRGGERVLPGGAVRRAGGGVVDAGRLRQHPEDPGGAEARVQPRREPRDGRRLQRRRVRQLLSGPRPRDAVRRVHPPERPHGGRRRRRPPGRAAAAPHAPDVHREHGGRFALPVVLRGPRSSTI